MSSARIDRRRALQLMSAVAASLCVPHRLSASASCTGALSEGVDLEGIRLLGQEYSARFGDGEGVRSIEPLLRELSLPQLIDELRTRVQNDFASGHVVHLSGWFLSRTEGRLFAALAGCAA